MSEASPSDASAATLPPAAARPRRRWVIVVLFAVVAATAASDLWLKFHGLAPFIRYNVLDPNRTALIAFVGGRVLLLLLALSATLAIGRRFRRAGRPAGTGALLAAAVLMLTFEAIGTAASAYQLPLVLKQSVAVSAIEGFETQYNVSAGTLAIRGGITPGLADAILHIESISRPVRTIEITSSGGMVEEALAVADFIRRRGIKVVARETCNSACIILAVASPESYAEEGLRFGFHSVYAVTDDQSEVGIYSAEQSKRNSRAFLLARGIPEQLLNEADKFGPDELLLVPAEALVRAGILKGLVPRDR